MTKSILSLFLVGLAIVNLVIMLEVLGRSDGRHSDPKRLRLIHRVFGYVFIALFLVLSYFCLVILRGMDHEPPSRVALHSLLSVAAFLVLSIKIAFVRFYKKYYAMAVSLGLMVFVLTLSTTAMSAGYYFTMRGTAAVEIALDMEETPVRQGVTLFNEKGCADCHHADRTDPKIGPGLKGLFDLERMPVSGWPATEDSLRKQLKTPFRAMPPYADLSEEDVDALVAFLRTL
jgi:mono/diheme cytochrome c family protein